jgi:hypothetical protein
VHRAEKHPMVKSVVFSPSGRLVATLRSQPFVGPEIKDTIDNGVRIYTAHGNRLTELTSEGIEALFSFAWRPRPTLLTAAETKRVRKELSEHIARFEEQDRQRIRKRRLRELVHRLHMRNTFNAHLDMLRAELRSVNVERVAHGLPAVPVGPLPEESELTSQTVYEEVVLEDTAEEVSVEQIASLMTSAEGADEFTQLALSVFPKALPPTLENQRWLNILGFALEECARPNEGPDSLGRTVPALPREARLIAHQAAEALRAAAKDKHPTTRTEVYTTNIRPQLATPNGVVLASRLRSLLPTPTLEAAEPTEATDAPSSSAAVSSSDSVSWGEDDHDGCYAAVLLETVCAHITANKAAFLLNSGADSAKLQALFKRARIERASLVSACSQVMASYSVPGLTALLHNISERLKVRSTSLSAASTAKQIAKLGFGILSTVPQLIDLAEILASEADSMLNSIPFPAIHPDFSEVHRSTKLRSRALARRSRG